LENDYKRVFISASNPLVVVALVGGVLLALALNVGPIIQWLSFGALMLYVLAIVGRELWP